jgi:hypothetical protein
MSRRTGFYYTFTGVSQRVLAAKRVAARTLIGKAPVEYLRVTANPLPAY